MRNKGYNIVDVRECNWWESVKQEEKARYRTKKNFPFKLPLKQETVLAKIKDGKMFGYLQYDLEVPDGLKYKFSIFTPIFINFNVSGADIGDHMRENAIKNNLFKQPQRKLISSFKLANGTIITTLLNFFLSLGLKCIKKFRFAQNTSKKCFNNLVQSLVDARRAGDENPDSSVVAETMKLLGNSSYGYQFMDRRKHAETKYLKDEMTHKAISGKMFKHLNDVSKEIYEVELAKSKIEHRETIMVGFFMLQYAKLRMSELYCSFFHRFCDVDKFWELEMDADSLYLALAHENLYDCIRPAKKEEWEVLREKAVMIPSEQMPRTILSLEHTAQSIRSTINESQDSSKKNSDVPK